MRNVKLTKIESSIETSASVGWVCAMEWNWDEQNRDKINVAADIHCTNDALFGLAAEESIRLRRSMRWTKHIRCNWRVTTKTKSKQMLHPPSSSSSCAISEIRSADGVQAIAFSWRKFHFTFNGVNAFPFLLFIASHFIRMYIFFISRSPVILFGFL